MNTTKRLFLVTLLVLGTYSLSAQYLNLREALFTGAELRGSSGPESVNWINGGEKFSYTIEGTIRSLTPSSQEDELIFTAEGINFPGTNNPFEYTSFQWSKDSKFIIFQSNFRPIWRNSGTSDYYLYSIETKIIQLVAKDARTAELSPDGTKVGFERDGDLFVFDLASKGEKQLTTGAGPQFYNGRYGWAYEEEFGLVQAWKWSNDSKYIAYWQTDEREVPVFRMTDYEGQHTDWIEIRYPAVGDTNPTVKIGVVGIETAETQWMNVGLGDGYIPRIYWTADADQLAIVHLNRKQNQLNLYFTNINSGESRLMMQETSKGWIDIYNFDAKVMDLFHFPENSKEFFWVSDRDGYDHIYQYDYEGKLIRQITTGNWDVTKVHDVDLKKKTIFYSSTETSPIERHLYATSFNGKKKRRLTNAAGKHEIDFSPGANYYIDSWSNTTTPLQVELWNTGGKMLKKMEDNAEVSKLISERKYAPNELMKFTSSDGTDLDAYVVKPFDFDETKEYPLVLDIYGGPSHQSVYNEFGSSGWHQYLAQEGFVVVSVNNRGSSGYGAAFKEIVYENLGNWEAVDFVETVKYFSGLPWVDGENMAIRGHSYGGYMSSLTMLKHPGVFKASIVTAPVTDWRLYDSIYTERYMGLLPENEEFYIAGSPSTYAGNLKGEMLIVHSTMDENVHVQNTFQLVKALIDNGKDHDLKIYPPGNHGVAYDGVSYVLLYTQYTDFLNKHLK